MPGSANLGFILHALIRIQMHITEACRVSERNSSRLTESPRVVGVAQAALLQTLYELVRVQALLQRHVHAEILHKHCAQTAHKICTKIVKTLQKCCTNGAKTLQKLCTNDVKTSQNFYTNGEIIAKSINSCLMFEFLQILKAIIQNETKCDNKFKYYNNGR